MNVQELALKYREEILKDLGNIDFLKAVYINLGMERFFYDKYYFGNSQTMKNCN